MNYGFVIDTRSCIGCHACSTACKSENQVPLGVNRTWVRYTEAGRFPDTRRSFQVTRCNHCANPPCARICPVTAMYQRTDGIVEFDASVCIGCKACLQACPYDAIYIDPVSKTAAKCHYCAHRVERGMEPACVVVCPTHAIIAGDMDDPNSEISRVIGRNDVTVRKPEQGTAPKLFYIGGHDASQTPTTAPREPAGLMFAEVLDAHGHRTAPDYGDATEYEVHLDLGGERPLATTPRSGPGASAPGVRTPGTQGVPAGGPIQLGGSPGPGAHPAHGTMAGHMTSQVSYTVAHRVPWHWQVPAYLVTKAIGAGAFLALVAGTFLGVPTAPAGAALATVGLLGLLVTTALLVGDLEHPQRFLRILTRPQWRSWLARGAFLLVGFSGLATAWWAAEVGGLLGWVDPTLARVLLGPPAVPLAAGVAVYTAWLFAQCEGRDLWQSPLLPVHLLVQALLMGAASVLLLAPVVDFGALRPFAEGALGVLLVLDALALVGELGIPHASEVAARAAHAITHGKYARSFWLGAVGLGHVAPLLLLMAGAGPLAAVLVIVGLYLYEAAFVAAPQDIPNA